jgi:polyisoprenoid-binding protein YceI
MKLVRPVAIRPSAASLLASAALALTLVPAARAAVTEYHLDPYHSEASVLVEHYGVSHLGGTFAKVDGTVSVDTKDWSGWAIDVSIPVFEFMASHPPRAEAVKGPMLLDAKTWPTMTFKSTKVEKKGDQYVATGAMTIRDVTKEISFPITARGPVSDPFGHERIGIEGEMIVKRSDFGLPFDRKMRDGSPVLGDEVSITLHVEGVKGGGITKKPEDKPVATDPATPKQE